MSKNGWCYGLIGLFVLLLWGQTARYEFVWDDGILITQNKSIRSLKNIPRIFTSVTAQSGELAPSFRPLRTAFYALLYAVDGQSAPRPWLFHLANILWHATAAMLLFSVALLLYQRLAAEPGFAARMTAGWIAIGFAAHPANAEAVCWVKCMDDLMAGVFVLAAARSLLKWNGRGPGYAAALGWFLLAAFSKESAVPFAAAVFFILQGIHKLPWRRSARLTLPFLLAAFFYAAWRRVVLGQSSQCPPLSGSYGQTLIDMFPVVTEYLRLLCGAPPFCADYNFMVGAPPHSLFSPEVLEGFLLLSGAAALTIWLWHHRPWRLAGFGFLWAALFFLPVSNLVPTMQYMAERFLYLPLMGFVMGLGFGCLNFSRLRLATGVAGVALIVVWAGTSLNRMGIWRDDLTLFVRTELEHPGIQRVERNAVFFIYQLPQMAALKTPGPLTPAQAGQIIDTLQQARRIFPENDILTAQLGLVEGRIEHWPEAASLLELAVRQNPGSADHWFDLASVYRLAGQLEKARSACAGALRLDPRHVGARRLQARLGDESKPASK